MKPDFFLFKKQTAGRLMKRPTAIHFLIKNGFVIR